MNTNDFIIITDRLKRLKDLWSDVALARLLGIKQPSFAERKGRGSLPYKEIIELCGQEGISLDWLFTGEGSIWRPSRDDHDQAPPGRDDFVYVPVTSVKPDSGAESPADNDVELTVGFSREWIQRHGDPKHMSLTKVTGDSMEPTLLSGDIVLVNRNLNSIDPQGGIYAITLDNIATIKRLQIIHLKGLIRIISDNPKYESLEASPDQITVNGRVICFARTIEK